MPLRDDPGERVHPKVHPHTWPGFYIAGAILVIPAICFIFMIGAWSTLVDLTLPPAARCLHVVETVFVAEGLATFGCIAFMAGGMHLIVTAFLKRHRFLFNFACAVFLTWLVVGLLLGFFLLGQLAR